MARRNEQQNRKGEDGTSESSTLFCARGGERKRKRGGRAWRSWRRPGWIGALAVVFLLAGGNWFAHLPTDQRATFGEFEATLEALGALTADGTDSIGLTGHDVYIPFSAPLNEKCPLPFGIPEVVDTSKAPSDIRVLRRQGYWAGFSPSLGYPVWSAYALPAEKVLEYPPARPPFAQDREVPGSPAPDAYTGSGYDRGHLAPNYAIATRYGRKAQRETFLMTNIAPQKPKLNRGPWRMLEQRVADDLSEIGDTLWVLVCAVPDKAGATLRKGSVRVPKGFAMIIAAVHQRHLRVIGVYMPQGTADTKRPRYCFRSVRALEELTGLNFFPALSQESQDVLEKREANRFWAKWDLF